MNEEEVEVSVIIPTKNDSGTLEKCLESVKNQDFPEENMEVITIDGHSDDSTVKIAKDYGCKVYYENQGTRAAACNIGIEKASGRYIAFTDADCVLPEEWLKNLTRHISQEKVKCVGGPNISPKEDTNLGRSLDSILAFLSNLGPRYRMESKEIQETFHNPGCNVLYDKSTLEEIGGFDEELETCEDEELDFRLKEKGYKIIFTPDAPIDHYRKPTWDGIVKKAYRYGIGRMQAIRKDIKMGKWFHFTLLTSLPVFLIFISLSPLSKFFFWGSLVMIILVLGGLFGIGTYLSFDREERLHTLTAILGLWVLAYGIGLFRGLIK